jgi:hypothetical protein
MRACPVTFSPFQTENTVSQQLEFQSALKPEGLPSRQRLCGIRARCAKVEGHVRGFMGPEIVLFGDIVPNFETARRLHMAV